MHGVKRLFSWMIPRFDRDRFDVSLVSLRRKDLSEETLDSLGIDITYLERSKFDPLTLVAGSDTFFECVCLREHRLHQWEVRFVSRAVHQISWTFQWS